jgi:putative membrane protein
MSDFSMRLIDARQARSGSCRNTAITPGLFRLQPGGKQMNRYIIAATFAALTMGSAVHAQETTGPDKVFVTKAANSNMFEIESSKLAIQKGQSAEVKSFAQQMIDDHTKAAKDLMAVAPDAPKKMDAAHTAMVEDLNKTSADKFDASYIDAQVKAHDEAVALFTKYSEDAEDAKLKAFASEKLPVLKQHQEHVKALDAKM